MTPVYIAGFGLASRLGPNLNAALSQLHATPVATNKPVNGLDHALPYYAIAPEPVAPEPLSPAPSSPKPLSPKPSSPDAISTAPSTPWYARCEALVRRVAHEAGTINTHGALYLASSSVNVGAIESGESDTDSLPAFVATLAAMLDWQGPVNWINTACTSSLNALLAAQAAIQTGQVDDALIIGLELENQFCLAGFAAMQLLSSTQPKPLARERDGLVLGEAVAALRLSKQASRWRLKGGAQVIDSSQLSGASVDAYHTLLQQSLARAQVTAEQIDLIKVQAAGSPPNDAVEAEALRNFFPTVPALVSLKTLLGHTLGASGAAEIALLLSLLHTQEWPDLTLDPDVLDPALGINFAPQRPPHIKHLLACNLGFGGSHTSVIIEDTFSEDSRQAHGDPGQAHEDPRRVHEYPAQTNGQALNETPQVHNNPTQLFKIHASFNQPIGEHWREQLIALMASKPRRLSRWCELGLFGALTCVQQANQPLSHQVAIRVYSQYGTLHATCKALAQAKDYLPMPFTFMQTQPGQLFNALGNTLGWHGDGYAYNNRTAGEIALLRSMQGSSLLAWVDDEPELISRWIWLEPAGTGCHDGNPPDCAEVSWRAVSSIFQLPASPCWLKIDANQQIFVQA